MRIVSLLPSATEIVCAIGARSQLVGVSHECDWPADVRQLPVVTRSRELGDSSAEIDARVRESMQDQALSIYEVIPETLAALAPDVVITQDLCQVCAVPASQVEQALARITDNHAQLIRLSPRSLNDVLDDIQRVAVAIGRQSDGVTTREELVERLRALVLRNRAAPAQVLSVEWLEPLMLGGLWTPELIDFAGGASLIANAGELAPTVSAGDLGELRPDLVLIKPCGYRLADSRRELDLIAALLHEHWPATINDRVFVVDGNRYFNRSGPGLIDSAELLSGLIGANPDASWFTRFGEYVAQYQRLPDGPGLIPVSPTRIL